MNDTTHLDEALSALRHDEGCSAAVGDYRCRCNVEDLRAQARAELARLREIVRRAEEQEKAADILRDVRETFRFSRGDKANAHAEYVEIHRSACRATESAVRAWREKREQATGQHIADLQPKKKDESSGQPTPEDQGLPRLVAGGDRPHELGEDQGRGTREPGQATASVAGTGPTLGLDRNDGPPDRNHGPGAVDRAADDVLSEKTAESVIQAGGTPVKDEAPRKGPTDSASPAPAWTEEQRPRVVTRAERERACQAYYDAIGNVPTKLRAALRALGMEVE